MMMWTKSENYKTTNLGIVGGIRRERDQHYHVELNWGLNSKWEDLVLQIVQIELPIKKLKGYDHKLTDEFIKKTRKELAREWNGRQGSTNTLPTKKVPPDERNSPIVEHYYHHHKEMWISQRDQRRNNSQKRWMGGWSHISFEKF